MPILQRGFLHRGSDIRSRGARREGRQKGLGEHRHVLRALQPSQRRAHAARGGYEARADAAATPFGSRHPHHGRATQRARELARLSILERRARRYLAGASGGLKASRCPNCSLVAGALRPPDRSATSLSVVSTSRLSLSSIDPLRACEGGRIVLHGGSFPVDVGLPRVTLGGVSARVAFASPRRLVVIVPAELEGGSHPVRF